MGIIHLTDSVFEEEVIRSPLPVLVDFWAPWCNPCLRLSPILDELAREYEGRIKIAKIDVDENKEKAAEYGIMSIPNIKLFKEGKVVEEIIGLQSKEKIKRIIDKVLG